VIDRYQAWQGAQYGKYERAVRSREVLIMSDGPGVRSAATGRDRMH